MRMAATATNIGNGSQAESGDGGVRFRAQAIRVAATTTATA